MLKASYRQYKFIFNFPGGTSRGVLNNKLSYFIKVWDDCKPYSIGLGEVSLIPNLSPETPMQVETLLDEFIEDPKQFHKYKELSKYPAVKFGIEIALLDLKTGGDQILYPSDFTKGDKGIRINGLIWMGDKDLMLQRLKDKVDEGFTCIKLKIGAIDFDDELYLLKHIRKTYSAQDLEIRVDANGAFTAQNVMNKLEILTKYNIHSIEQPIKQGQWSDMAKVCQQTPLPIALDEELIGVTELSLRTEMLDTIKPQYIILKPSLIGGFSDTEIWSSLANERDIGWWVTSALEGNIGLNAIAQWTYLNGSDMPQGLGTGQVFINNTTTPLNIKGEQLWHSL